MSETEYPWPHPPTEALPKPFQIDGRWRVTAFNKDGKRSFTVFESTEQRAKMHGALLLRARDLHIGMRELLEVLSCLCNKQAAPQPCCDCAVCEVANKCQTVLNYVKTLR